MATQVDVANNIGADKMMVSNVLRTLEKKGYITRNPTPYDSHAKLISLTSIIEDTIKKSLKIVENTDDKFFEKLGIKEQFFRFQMIEIIDKIVFK